MFYSKALKAEAVDRVLKGESVAAVAKDSRVLAFALEHWVDRARIELVFGPRESPRAEQRRLDREQFDRDLGVVLTRLGRDDDYTRAIINRRRLSSSIVRWAFSIGLLVIWGVRLIFALSLSAALYASVFGSMPESATLSEQIIGRVVFPAAFFVALVVIDWCLRWLMGTLWELTGPFTLCVGALVNLQAHIRKLPFSQLPVQRPWSQLKLSDRRFAINGLRVVERQLSRNLLLYPGFGTTGARGAQIHQRRRVASTVAYIEVNLVERGSIFVPEALSLLRHIEILTLLRDWSEADLPRLDGSDVGYRGWIRTAAGFAWAGAAVAIAAASLYLQATGADWRALLPWP